jgi:hypothetical protein
MSADGWLQDVCPQNQGNISNPASLKCLSPVRTFLILPESCTKYRGEATKAVCLKRSWSDFDPQAYDLCGEDQNHETSFKGRALQAEIVKLGDVLK